eukprot:superscaffoldBa00010523_g24755
MGDMLVYLDDITVLGQDINQMLEWLSQVFTWLVLKPCKCCLFQEQVSYLGHVISAKGIATKPQKVQKVAEGPTPQNISEVCQFVGLTFYYQCFVRILLQWLNCSMNSAECQKAFEDLKVSEYDFWMLHRPGRLHQDADTLPRRPWRSSCPCTMPEPDFSSDQHRLKGVQCSLTDCPVEGVLLTTPPEQYLVRVVDVISNNSCGHLLSHPSVNRVSESLQAHLFGGWTQEQLKAVQMTYPDIVPMCKCFEEGGSQLTWADIAPCSPATKAYWAQWKRLFQRDGVILGKFYCAKRKVS